VQQPIDQAYTDYYQKKDSLRHIYPVEFVVRTFLGTYPGLKMDRKRYAGSRILDLGYGDGRNFPLLHNLGFKIFGVEIADHINQLAEAKFKEIGIPVELRKGQNSEIPYSDKYFDYALACHSLYYVNSGGDTFDNNLTEVARVLAPGGILIASLPIPSTYILKGARELPGGHQEITHDPLGLRNGTIFRVFQDKDEIVQSFSPYFENFSIGACEDDFFGIQQNVWIVVCTRKN